MHLVAVKDDTVARHPELPTQLMAAFADAEAITAEYFTDPNWQAQNPNPQPLQGIYRVDPQGAVHLEDGVLTLTVDLRPSAE